MCGWKSCAKIGISNVTSDTITEEMARSGAFSLTTLEKYGSMQSRHPYTPTQTKQTQNHRRLRKPCKECGAGTTAARLGLRLEEPEDKHHQHCGLHLLHIISSLFANPVECVAQEEGRPHVDVMSAPHREDIDLGS